ncbi:MAG: FtsX-like permease family protein [Chlorobi bacterium]|nr:FtsX-like permease family protein [Chlorobiota bacterium]
MFKNYLLIALRNINRYKAYTFVNIAGLAIGITSFLFILIYVFDEMNYDAFHSKSDRIYRVNEIIESEAGIGERSASVPIPLAKVLKTECPEEVEETVRFFNMQSPSFTIAYEDKKYSENRFFFADSTLFNVFDFKIVDSIDGHYLSNPFKVMITQSMAKKYFGDENPLGEKLMFENWQNFTVTGILEDAPYNSHFHFDFIASFSSIYEFIPNADSNWYWNPAWTYILLRNGVKPAKLESKFPALVKKYFYKTINKSTVLSLQPLKDIHLKSNLDYEIEINGNSTYINIFKVIALLVLIIASTNFMNLLTAYGPRRAPEVGVRKVVGAFNNQISRQFIGEAVIQAIIAVFISLFITELAIPIFNSFSGKNIQVLFYLKPIIFTGLLLLALIIGIISGAYPAFYLAKLKPVKLMKSSNKADYPKFGVKQLLVIIQFAVSTFLIIATLFANKQLNFLQNAPLGFNDKNVIMIPVARTKIVWSYNEFKKQLIKNKHIKGVTAMEDVIGVANQTATFRLDGKKDLQQFSRLFVKKDFIETMGIRLISGFGFKEPKPEEPYYNIVINKAMADYLGWTPREALNKLIFSGKSILIIKGVSENFYFGSLHQKIAPFLLMNPSPYYQDHFIKYLAIRTDGKNNKKAIQFINQQWNKFDIDLPFEYFYLKSAHFSLYKTEKNLTALISAFSFLAIFIACLGLFGLSAFYADQRIKEIGIHKVLGASIIKLILLLSKDILQLVLLSFIVAMPLAYFAINKWLESFSSHINLSLFLFLLSGLLSFTIALLTVSYQAYKAANINPAETLRYE